MANKQRTILKRIIAIQRAVQIFLLVLLVFVAFQLQGKMTSAQFLKVAIATMVAQLALFYPLNKLAGHEAARELETSAPGVPVEKLVELRRKRIFSDILKGSFFLFFVAFIALSPEHPLVQAFIFFTFILTTLTFIQCFIASLKKGMPKE